MKYEYKSGRNIIPDGIKSDSLKCFECGEPQSRSYCTKDGKNICSSCKTKDEKGELKMENNDRNFIVFLYNMVREEDTKMSNQSNNIPCCSAGVLCDLYRCQGNNQPHPRCWR